MADGALLVSWQLQREGVDPGGLQDEQRQHLLGRLLVLPGLRRLPPGLLNLLDRLWVDVLGEIGRVEFLQPVAHLLLRRELEEVLKSVPLVERTIDSLIRIFLCLLLAIRP